MSIRDTIEYLRPGITFGPVGDGFGCAIVADPIERIAEWNDNRPQPTIEEIASAAEVAAQAFARLRIPPVTARQMLVAMDEIGLLDTVEAYVATQPRVAQITWQRAQEFERGNELLNAGAAAMGMTPEQVDELFALARTK